MTRDEVIDGLRGMLVMSCTTCAEEEIVKATIALLEGQDAARQPQATDDAPVTLQNGVTLAGDGSWIECDAHGPRAKAIALKGGWGCWECASEAYQNVAARQPQSTATQPATFTHAEAHTICALLTEAEEESERGMPSGIDPEMRGHIGHLMAKVWAANAERQPQGDPRCAGCPGGCFGGQDPATCQYVIEAERQRAGLITTTGAANVVTPPAPQRFWRVARHQRWWLAAACDAHGIIGEDAPAISTHLHATREQAEADGRDSGLDEWKGGKQ